MQLTDLFLKKFRNKEIILIDSDNFVYEILSIDANNNKLVVKIRDIILTTPKQNPEDDGIENRAANSDWNERTTL